MELNKWRDRLQRIEDKDSGPTPAMLTPEDLKQMRRHAVRVLAGIEIAPVPLHVRVRLLLHYLDTNVGMIAALSEGQWGSISRFRGGIRRHVLQSLKVLDGLQVRTMVNVALVCPFVDLDRIATRHWSTSSLKSLLRMMLLQVRTLRRGAKGSGLLPHGFESDTAVSSDSVIPMVVYAAISTRTRECYVGSTTRGCGVRQAEHRRDAQRWQSRAPDSRGGRSKACSLPFHRKVWRHRGAFMDLLSCQCYVSLRLVPVEIMRAVSSRQVRCATFACLSHVGNADSSLVCVPRGVFRSPGLSALSVKHHVLSRGEAPSTRVES